MKNYIVINGKKAELTEKQLKQLGIEVKKETPFERKNGKVYYVITQNGKVTDYQEENSGCDEALYNIANYCTDETLMRQRALHEILNRLLWRFACENGELENEWNYAKNIEHYYIYFDETAKEFGVDFCLKNHANTVYFPTQETAEKAIGLIRQFMEEHPDFIW